MRKLVVAFIIGACLSTPTSAQTKGDFEFGFNTGFNRSSAAAPNVAFDHGFGFNIGVSTYYYFSSSWSLEAKFIYDQKGWDNSTIFDEAGNGFRTNFNVNYLTVPLMANYYFGEDEKKNWFIEFGPYAGFLLSAEDTRFGTDVKESFNKTDYGLCVGVGIKIPVNNKFKILVELEGQSGFANIFNDTSDMKNRRTALNVGLNYTLK